MHCRRRSTLRATSTAAAFAAILLTLGAAPATHAQQLDRFHTLQTLDQRLFSAGWKLTTGNARYCRAPVPALGVLWQDLASYPDPEFARETLGVVGPVTAQAVAAGSPADRSGLKVDDTLVAIAYHSIAAQFPPSDPPWERMREIDAAIAADLADDGTVTLAYLGSPSSGTTTAILRGVPACPSRFEVATIGRRATADGRRVVFGTEFPAFGYPEDEFAAAVAHELAHNLLGHRAWLDVHGRKRANIRVTEREADRLAPWLLANAGYDPAAMLRLMRRWGPEHGGGLFRKRDHQGWDERAEAIAAELERVKAARQADGSADWAQAFDREAGS